MANTEREEKILDILKERTEVSVSALTELLFASEATVRRGLKRLEERGLIFRAHGKAVNAKLYADKNEDFSSREITALPIKKRIANKAVKSCIKNGFVVMLDASTTVTCAVDFLSSYDDLIVITSGLKSLVKLANTTLKFYSTGGKAINGSSSFVGQTAINAVDSFNADVCLISCHGISSDGYLTDTSEPENDLRKAMLKRAKRKILLVDSTKINKSFWHNLCHISEFDDVFCDEPLPENIAKSIKTFHLVTE